MRNNFPFNVLRTSQTVIRTQTFIVRRFTGRTRNAIGNYVAEYADPVTVEGSVQPISRNLYKKMGLDFEKSYISILAVEEITDLARDRSGDQIIIDGQLFETIGQTDWQRSADWQRVVCVRVGVAP